MAQVIKIQLIQSLILNSVKNETYLSGQLTKADNEKLVATAYHEAAGDEQYHQRMLSRGMFTQAEKLKTWFDEYLTGPGNTVDDPLVSSEETTDSFVILLKVSDRFNLGYVKTLARLGQKYVEDRMIHLWTWKEYDAASTRRLRQLLPTASRTASPYSSPYWNRAAYQLPTTWCLPTRSCRSPISLP